MANASGCFKLDRPLTVSQHEYLKAIASTKRVLRDEAILKYYEDPLRKKIGILDVGHQGEYFVGNAGTDDNDPSIIDEDVSPGNQPSNWCAWVPSNDGYSLVYNQEKDDADDSPIEWTEYLLKTFLIPWGYTVNGTVNLFTNEDSSLTITVTNNEIEVVVDEDSKPESNQPPTSAAGNYKVLSQKWTVLVEMRDKLVAQGVPSQAANMILAATCYKCKASNQEIFVDNASNLYKFLADKEFDTTEVVKLTAAYMNNEF